MDWTSKYHPKSLDEVVGNSEVKEAIKMYISDPTTMPHLLFAGKTGTGKTTMAYILVNAILGRAKKINFKEINASNDNNVDYIRNVVINYMRYPPIFQDVPFKILLMDEADYLTAEAQACLRRPLEKYKKNCRVILTANNPNKIIDAIKEGRCQFFKFHSISKSEMRKRLEYIAEQEGVDVDIDEIIQLSNGSMRNAISIMQQRAITVNIKKGDIIDELLKV